MRANGDDHSLDSLVVVRHAQICASCDEQLTSIRLSGREADFNPVEAECFVAEMPAGAAGAMLAALALKMARSWGEEEARKVLLLKLDQALRVLRETRADA